MCLVCFTLVGWYVKSFPTRSKVELQQRYANIQGLSWQCMGISIWGCHTSSYLFFIEPNGHKASTLGLRKIPRSLTLAIHDFSTLQWFEYFRGINSFFFYRPHVVLFCAKLDFKIYIIVSKITLIYFVVCLKNRQS